MASEEIEKHIAIGKEVVVYNVKGYNDGETITVRYRIDNESKEVRLYDLPKILTFQDKAIIYYAILDKLYFRPVTTLAKEHKAEHIEDYIVKENGHTYHEFNNIEGESYGILGELLFEIPRQRVEVEKLSRIRDIYDMLTKNITEIGKRPICIAFNGLLSDFKDVCQVIEYMFKHHKDLIKKKDEVKILKKGGILGINKRVYITPKNA